jgi:hypothetical protein
MNILWLFYLKMTLCERAKRLHPLRRNIYPSPSNITSADHRPLAPPDIRRRTWWGSCPSMIEMNLWGSRRLSRFIHWWIVTPNSKSERSMALGLGDDGDGDGIG